MNPLRIALVALITVVSLLLPDSSSAADKESDVKIVVKKDIVYGRILGAGLLADVAYPESDKPLPAIISVHGGRWRGGKKTDKDSKEKGIRARARLRFRNGRFPGPTGRSRCRVGRTSPQDRCFVCPTRPFS